MSSREILQEAFFDAIYQGDCVKVEQMLSEGFSANALNREGETALVYAASHGKDECVQSLLDYGAAFQTLPMVDAAVSSDPSVMRRFLHMGGDPNATDWQGQTPLMEAASYGNTEVVAMLLAHGADPQKKTPSGHSAFDSAVVLKEVPPEVREKVLLLLQEASRNGGAVSLSVPLSESV